MLQRSQLLASGSRGISCRWRATQYAAISFQQSMSGIRTHLPSQLSAVSTVIPDNPGDILVLSICKVKTPNESRSEDTEVTIPQIITGDIRSLIEECVTDGSFTANVKEKYVLRVPSKSDCIYKHIILLGMDSEPSVNAFKDLGKQLCVLAKELKSPNVDLFLGLNDDIPAVLRGLGDVSYDDRRYKGSGSPDSDKDLSKLKRLTFTGVDEDHVSTISKLLDLHLLTMQGVTLAKDMIGAPPNSKTPLAISDFARDIASSCVNMDCKVLGIDECRASEMGGFLAVQQGSKYPPQFIHMTYNNKNHGTKKPKKIAIVGKGLTFDSGGYNLKVGAASMIEMMKFDMGGLGAVLGTAASVAAIDSSSTSGSLFNGIEVHFISAVCENMISRDAMRPGDIVTASNGKTIEILNTDAEGRLTLADALVYADTVVNADVTIDLATLTGASIIALGENVGSLFAAEKCIQEDLMQAAKRSGDQLWSMPLHEEYRDNIKSKIADIKNIGDGKGGSITAALFLQEFVPKGQEWAHIDMAGPVWDNASHKPTGYGVKLLVEYLIQQAQRATH